MVQTLPFLPCRFISDRFHLLSMRFVFVSVSLCVSLRPFSVVNISSINKYCVKHVTFTTLSIGLSEESRNEKSVYASVPYIKGISERLQRAFLIVHKPFNSLRSQLVHVKDKTENLKKCGTVYHIQCEQCDKEYVGESSRLLETRIKEHLSGNSSAFHEHCQLTWHSVDSSKTKVLATESNTFKRRIREEIEIRLRKPSLNRDHGFELAKIFNTILGPSTP